MTGLGYVTMCMLRARPWLNERSHHARWPVLGSVSVYLTQRIPNLVASCLQRCFYKELNCPTSRWTTELHLVCAHHLFHTLRDDILSLLSLLSASPSRSSSVSPPPSIAMAIFGSEKRSSSNEHSPARDDEKGVYAYEHPAVPEVGTTEDASHSLHRGLQARQVSMIAIGGAM